VKNLPGKRGDGTLGQSGLAALLKEKKTDLEGGGKKKGGKEKVTRKAAR